ncbi:RNA polymerase II accessory factor [Backusella circina FSU 941]|nr:RNA polymerase II accessory factor [Backusella circina FSU 941]
MATDSVALLRQYTMGKKPITLLNDVQELVKTVADATTIKFDTTSFPRAATTIIKKGASSDEHYTLDTLIFLVENANLDNSAYFKECRSRRLEHVSIVDRRKILDYLTGKVDQIPNVSTLVDLFNPHHFFSIHLSTLLSVNKRHTSQQQQQQQQQKAVVKGQKLSNKDRIPLIIVPAAPTAKFTLYNIKQFLEDQKYVDAQVLREEGLKKPEKVTVERKKPNGQSIPYHVVDSVANFKQTDWDRVCCVFVAGQLWQFKGWKWEKPVELFSHVKGFYPKWTSDKLNSPASDWAITELNIHHHKRHMDRSAVSGFWDALDSYIATHKSYLNF